MGELLIVSKSPSELHPEGRHYVAHTMEATLQDTTLNIKANIVAIGNTFDEAQAIVNNLK